MALRANGEDSAAVAAITDTTADMDTIAVAVAAVAAIRAAANAVAAAVTAAAVPAGAMAARAAAAMLRDFSAASSASRNEAVISRLI